jgi:hypothetical protein
MVVPAGFYQFNSLSSAWRGFLQKYEWSFDVLSSFFLSQTILGRPDVVAGSCYPRMQAAT